MTTLLASPDVWNPEAVVHAEPKIWGASTDNLIRESNYFQVFTKIYKAMRSNFWEPDAYPIVQDRSDFHSLAPIEHDIFKSTIGYLTFLDSIQVANLDHVHRCITAPLVRMPLIEQQTQEALHARSYQVILLSLFDCKEERDEIYNRSINHPLLRARCSSLVQFYQRYQDTGAEEDYLYMLVADLLLEGVYFYNSFVYFYNLYSRGGSGAMAQTTAVIKLINRDEETHIFLFTKLLREAMKVFPHSEERIYEIVANAVADEIAFTNQLFDNKLPGINDHLTDEYTRYLGNQRLKSIGLEPLWGDASNPFAHLDRIYDPKGDRTRTAMFEAKPTNYRMTRLANLDAIL